MKRPQVGPKRALLTNLLIFSCLTLSSGQQDEQPEVVQSASHLSLDGLTLVIVFDRQVNLTSTIELIHQQRADNELLSANLWTRASQDYRQQVCRASGDASEQEKVASSHKIAGIQICAKLLTKKSLKLLHKYRLLNCIWSSRIQLLIELGAPASGPLKLTLKRSAIAGRDDQMSADDEISVELSKMQLELMGVPLVPRLALTGPNQVAPCGRFSLSAHLSSPFGLQSGESVRLSWSVERMGLQIGSANSSDQASDEFNWQALRQQVAQSRSNNLLLDAALLQMAPQVYQFQLSATFTTQLKSVTLNATHRLSRLDYEVPLGSIYGTHMLQSGRAVNPSQDLLLLADVQVPECARTVKQVGLYWQVSDSRVQFEQTYAPFYVARANSLPEQSELEFRLNLFYGVRVKRSALASAKILVGEYQPEAAISGGLLAVTVQSERRGHQLELSGASQGALGDRYGQLWSCFDGKTAQTCSRGPANRPAVSSDTNSNSTRYDLAAASQSGAAAVDGSPLVATGSPLIDQVSRSQQVLRLPLSLFEPDAQLWFGLQRFDRFGQQQAGTLASARTEYALVSVQRSALPLTDGPLTVSVGPVLLGARQLRATVRNPLTGAVMLSAGLSTLVVGRLSPSRLVSSFSWRAPNQIQPLSWNSRNATNELTGEQEIVTELHLPPEVQLAHAHLQIQLVACDVGGGQTTTSLALDVVPSVSQCSLAVGSRLGADPMLQVSVDFCNLPANLAPATYQLQALPAGLGRARPADGQPEESDYLNESDEEQMEARLQPISIPQLSPVFVLPWALLEAVGGAQGRVRLAARVCDRLQACRDFYSGPLETGVQNSSNVLGAIELLSEGAKRAQLAGSSLTALASSLAALELASSRPDGPQASLQTAARDTLFYCSQSVQRQFHFTDSGQTSLATRAMARILEIPQASIELKYRAARLLSQLTRRSLLEQGNLKSNCLADWRSIKVAYESLLATFSHFSVFNSPAEHELMAARANHLLDSKLLNGSSTVGGLATQRKQQVGANESQWRGAAQASASNRKREEAILAYLKSIRLAQRALIAASSAQLNLGEERELVYRFTPSESAHKRRLQDQIRSEPSPMATPTTAPLPATSTIISRLAHLTRLSGSISLDLTRDFGTKVSLGFDPELVKTVNDKTQKGQIKCRNLTERASVRWGGSSAFCSSFVLVITSYAGKAPFRSLDDGPALRLPLVEVNLLSPVDGSDLLELSKDLAIGTSSLTFTFRPQQPEIAQEEPSARRSSRRTFKCYKFDEGANEWARDSLRATADDQADAEEPNRIRSVRCSFQGSLGAFAAFQGKPPPGDGALGLPHGATLAGLIILVALVSLLGCLASSGRSRQRSRGGTV